MRTEFCNNCRFAQVSRGTERQLWECRRYAPAPRIMDRHTAVMLVWPIVAAKDWCGEWEGVEDAQTPSLWNPRYWAPGWFTGS